MGDFVSKMLSTECDTPRLLMLGLDGAGKTTMLYRLKLNEPLTFVVPTIGHHVETVTTANGASVTIWDVKGEPRVWRFYLGNVDGLIYVVDSSDRDRLDEARDALFRILEYPEMTGVPVVVMANKQDLSGACSSSELMDAILPKMGTRKWHIQQCCANSGEGVQEALNRMVFMVKDFHEMKKARNIS